jgi:hypothetical protein
MKVHTEAFRMRRERERKKKRKLYIYITILARYCTHPIRSKGISGHALSCNMPCTSNTWHAMQKIGTVLLQMMT